VTLGRSGACPREQSRAALQEVESSPRRRLDGFRSGAKHLGLSETVALRGAAAEGDLGRVLAERGSLQPPRSKDAATRVLEGTFEEGSSPVRQANPSLVRPRPTPAAEAKASGARAARFTELSSVRESVRGAPRESGESSVATWVRRLRESGSEK